MNKNQSSNNSLLDDEEIKKRLKSIDGNWELSGNKLVCEFEFSDFKEAFSFMTAVALISERLFHHPEWSNVYNKVSIAITNHSTGGLTELDFEFVKQVNKFLG